MSLFDMRAGFKYHFRRVQAAYVNISSEQRSERKDLHPILLYTTDQFLQAILTTRLF
jgi:hypothetical protein